MEKLEDTPIFLDEVHFKGLSVFFGSMELCIGDYEIVFDGMGKNFLNLIG